MLRWFAETMRRAIRMFGINDTFPIEGALGLTSLQKAEYLLETLVAAGFEAEEAARATNVVIELALTSGTRLPAARSRARKSPATRRGHRGHRPAPTEPTSPCCFRTW